MAELKTQRNAASVAAFLDGVADDERRRDCKTVVRIMKIVTGAKPEMWGTSIVGFGEYRYTYASGRQGDWPLAGFSPRKQDLSLYVMGGLERHAALLTRLGRYKAGKGCLYIKRLADVDLKVLEQLVSASVKHMRRTHG